MPVNDSYWRYEVIATMKATGERRSVGRATDSSSARALIESAKAQGIYADVRLTTISQPIEVQQ